MAVSIVPVPITHISEEHGFVAQQRCACGGEYNAERWEIESASNDAWHERAICRCKKCGDQHDFVFDITSLFRQALTDDPLLGSAWPIPFEGPYAIRRLGFQSSAAAIHDAVERGELTTEEAQRWHRNLIDDTFATINGRYQAIGIRKGSMGFSYLCIDKQWTSESPRPYFVVCKCLGRSQDSTVVVDDLTIDSLAREVEVWATLGDHPNIVKLLEVLQLSTTSPVLVLQAVLPGPHGRTTLQDWLNSKELSWPIALRLARDLCQAILHCQKRLPAFVHGDLKPSNLLVDVPGGYRLKLTDFGLSRGYGLADHEAATTIGTPMYRAPECWQGNPRTHASDVYATGLVLCELVTGRHPLASLSDVAEIRQQHLAGLRPRIDPPAGYESLDTLIQQCVATDPARRPSATEIASVLGVALQDEGEWDESSQAAEWNDRGTALTALGKHEDAIQCYVEALSREPDNPHGWGNLALAYSKVGLRTRADDVYRRCFEMLNASAELHANYAAHIFREGKQRLDETIEHCDKALAIDESCLTALINKAAALNSLGRHQEAAVSAEQARRLSPVHSHALIELATAQWKLGKRHQAWKLCDKILNIDPRFEPARNLKRMLRNKPR